MRPNIVIPTYAIKATKYLNSPSREKLQNLRKAPQGALTNKQRLLMRSLKLTICGLKQ